MYVTLLTKALGQRICVRQGVSGPVSLYPESVSGVRIWMTFKNPKFNGNYLVQGHSYDKVFMKIRSVLPDTYDKLWKNTNTNVEEFC